MRLCDVKKLLIYALLFGLKLGSSNPNPDQQSNSSGSLFVAIPDDDDIGVVVGNANQGSGSSSGSASGFNLKALKSAAAPKPASSQPSSSSPKSEIVVNLDEDPNDGNISPIEESEDSLIVSSPPANQVSTVTAKPISLSTLTSSQPTTTPKVQEPKPAPQVSAPQVSAPQVSAPQVSAPQVSAPQVSAPPAQSPPAQSPPAQSPAADTTNAPDGKRKYADFFIEDDPEISVVVGNSAQASGSASGFNMKALKNAAMPKPTSASPSTTTSQSITVSIDDNDADLVNIQVTDKPPAQPETSQPASSPASTATAPPDQSPYSKGASINDIKLVTSYSGTESINDTSKFDLKDFKNTLTYFFNKGANCVEIRLRDKEVWKYTNVPENVFPISVSFRKDIPTVLIQFKDCFYVYRSDTNKFKLLTMASYRKLLYSVKIHTSDGTKISMNDKKAFEFTRYGLIFNFKFKQGFLCTQVDYKEKLLWKHDGGQSSPYPSEIFVDLFLSKVDVIINNAPSTIDYVLDKQDLIDPDVAKLLPSINKLSEPDLILYIFSQSFDCKLDTKHGINPFCLKFVDVRMWSNSYGTPDYQSPLLSKPLFASAYCQDCWSTGLITNMSPLISQFAQLQSTQQLARN